MAGGNYVPMFIAIAIFLIVGSLPLFISPFINTSLPNNQSVAVGVSYFVTNGVSFSLPSIFFFSNSSFTFGINPFSFLGNATQQTLISYVNSFTYVPNTVAIPIYIVLIFSIVYFIIKLIPTEA